MAVNLREYLSQIEASTLELKEKLKNPELDATQKQDTENTLERVKLCEQVTRNMLGDYSCGRVELKEALASTDAIKLFPKVIVGKMIEAAEPAYLGSNFFDKIKVPETGGTVYQVPIVGEIYAREVSEGGIYNEQNVDVTSMEQRPIEVRVRKVGARVSITEEAIKDSAWDVLGLNARKMGHAMARYKEEMSFNNFTTHGNTIFDNDLAATVDPELRTTGRGQDGAFNATLSLEDLIEMCLSMMEHDKIATDVIMHPLTWLVFARNAMVGNGMTWGAFGGQNVHPWGAVQGSPAPFGLANNGAGQKYILTPEQTQNRLPFALNMNLSPFIPFDKKAKKFDMYVLDRNNVGCLIEKEALTTGSWSDPERDIMNQKAKERYGMGIYENGEGITVARNIAALPTYPVPPTISVKTN